MQIKKMIQYSSNQRMHAYVFILANEIYRTVFKHKAINVEVQNYIERGATMEVL